jgi:hypothetical protein
MKPIVGYWFAAGERRYDNCLIPLKNRSTVLRLDHPATAISEPIMDIRR